jgi:hypothetical protein
LAAVLIIGTAVFGQQEEAWLVDKFGDLSCEEVRGRVDLLLTDLTDRPGSHGVFVYYDGRFADYRGERWRPVLPAIGQAQSRMDFFRSHLLFRQFDLSQITFVSGGFRKNYEVELWLVPPNGRFPTPAPALTSMKYRKGKLMPIVDCP